MTEEEKKAIEYLRKWVAWETAGERNLEGDIEAALNLIEKQQKEIEELKLITKEYDSYIGEKIPLNSKIIIADREYFINGTFVEKYISKDKIKERIKNAEILKHNYLGNTEVSAIVYKDIIKIIDTQINILKELLEE